MAGKMRPVFYDLHAATLTRSTTVAQLRDLLTRADGFPERRRLSEGAVYATALRRWLMLTGGEWKATQVTAGDETWGQSDHSYRLRSRPDGSYDARCSCGAATVVFVAADGPLWHEAHVAGRIPGQVPARMA